MKTTFAGLTALALGALFMSTPVLAADVAIEPEPEPVITEDGNNWYFSIHGGVKFGEDWDDDWEGDDIELETDNGWRVGAAVGYSLGSIFGIEGEISYLNQDFDEAHGDLGDFDLEGDASIWTGMVNLIAGFPVGTIIRPYVGAGLGFAHVSFDDLEDLDLDDSDTAFAAQGFAGLDLVLSDRFAIGGRYRVLHIGDIEFEDDLGDHHDLDSDLIHSLEAVLTVGF